MRLEKSQVENAEVAPVEIQVHLASAAALWAMKRASQIRDRQLLKGGIVAPEAFLFIKQVKGAQIEWPKCSLTDDTVEVR